MTVLLRTVTARLGRHGACCIRRVWWFAAVAWRVNGRKPRQVCIRDCWIPRYMPRSAPCDNYVMRTCLAAQASMNPCAVTAFHLLTLFRLLTISWQPTSGVSPALEGCVTTIQSLGVGQIGMPHAPPELCKLGPPSHSGDLMGALFAPQTIVFDSHNWKYCEA
ncbi:hypothetical protein K491DRAFT_116112 [Lophiostoma macrostomum CBS 122681]|uniref:Uncharacterized protein n=1 Tax=Lophiostoma macrostomum CBS 122681 TaxID=1314788 RepID=A0A6A6SSW0_9PLEO|nr:hypothetical protein K491DRAFT_116112 [Lophiostoma macrostomum CBS 122681]